MHLVSPFPAGVLECHIDMKADNWTRFIEYPDWGADSEQDQAILCGIDTPSDFGASNMHFSVLASEVPEPSLSSADPSTTLRHAQNDDAAPVAETACSTHPTRSRSRYSPVRSSKTPLHSKKYEVSRLRGPRLTQFQDIFPERIPSGKDHELYEGWEVRVTGGWKKGCYGTVKATLAGKFSVLVKLEHTGEELLLHVGELIHRHSGLYLEEARFTAPDVLQTLREAREAANYHEPFVVENLPQATDEWPEVSAPVLLLPPALSLPPPSSQVRASAAGLSPGEWLCQEALVGQSLDLLVLDNVYWGGSLYDNTAYIERVPRNFKKGDHATMSIKIGLAATKVRKIQLIFLEPLTTNDLEGYISKKDAVPINNLWGVQVVIIGPTILGDWKWVGYRGWTDHGNCIAIGNQRLWFPLSSSGAAATDPRWLCPSDAYLPRTSRVPPAPATRMPTALSSNAGANAVPAQVIDVDAIPDDIIDVDTVLIPGPQRFFSFEGTNEYCIDIDRGSTLHDSISVDDWATLSDTPNAFEATAGAGPSTLPQTVVWSNAHADTLHKPVVLRGCFFPLLCAVEVGVDVGGGVDFDSRDSPPENGFTFLKGPGFTHAFETVVVGQDARDGYYYVTLVPPTAFIGNTDEVRERERLFVAQATPLDDLVDLDARSGLWIQWKDGKGVATLSHWTGHPAYNGAGAGHASLEIYVRLESALPVPNTGKTVVYACNLQIFQAGDRRWPSI
ncbi:hypothetical protein C8J57DRAFT_1224173 [Mycena rebaudengoi]|nr:hypothetical protein C8J57DRAFT_1224173 [Mycena rebaudengoi]